MVTTLLSQNLDLIVGKESAVTTAYIMYRGERVDVKVNSTFQGGTGLMANVEALQGYPFYSADVQSQGETYGAWNCNGYRVRADFVNVEVVHDPEDYAPHPVDQAQRVEREIDETLSRHVSELKWGNVVFDLDAMGENARQRSQALKAQIDKRLAEVRERNRQDVKRVSGGSA